MKVPVALLELCLGVVTWCSAQKSHAYAVGYAVCESALGLYKKPLEHPILKASKTVIRPEGGAFFTGDEGKLWFSYHAWTAPYTMYPKGARSLQIDRVCFAKGQVVIKSPSETPQPFGGHP